MNQVRDLSQQLRFQLSKFHYGSNYLRVHQGALRATVQDSLQALYRQLLAPLAPALADRGLVIVPHGPLHYLPFHALYDGRQYLLERHQVSYAPSAAVWQMCLGKQPRALGPALVLGVPDQGIPYVLDEVRGVGQTLGQARVLIGAEATTEALRRWGPEARLIHLASHGAFRADNPLFSALRLGDGWLTAREVYGLELRGTLVTLSACDTGLNQVAAGDELIGLARGFLYAGAPSLVVSLWTVHDQAAAALMQHFYTALSQGLGKAAALRLAQLETLADHPHPYYWAPFVLMGQGQ
ncbi:MAG: CHAT domain-containing protein [Deinococcus sp.]|nr:CHAT domain-containing protein [Deinococcus sp.]